MADVALRDVGHRQVGDDPPTVRELDQLVVGANGLADVGVGDLHPLRRARGARGVDQRQNVVGLHRAPVGLEVEVGVATADELVQRHRFDGRLAVDHDHPLDALDGDPGTDDLVHVRLLRDHHPRCRVPQEVGDLLLGIGVVNGERGPPEVHDRGIGEVELGPVDEHQGDRVTRAQAGGRQPHGNRLDSRRVLPPGASELVAAGADRRPVRVGGRSRLERLTCGAPVQSGGPLRPPPHGLDLHPPRSLSGRCLREAIRVAIAC